MMAVFTLIMAEIYSTILLLTMMGFIPITIPSPLLDASGLDTNDTKNNYRPVVLLSHYVRAIEGQLVTLDASKSFDPDGDRLKFSWKKISHDDTKVNLLNDKSPVATFVVPPLQSKVVILFEVSILDGNGNSDTGQIHVIASSKVDSDSKQAHLIKGESEPFNKKDQVDKERAKSLVLSSSDGDLNSSGTSDSKRGSLGEDSGKSSSFADNKIKVNAGPDIEVTGGNIAKLNGKLLSKFDSAKIKLLWTQKKGPHLQLSSNDILDPLFIAPHVENNERIEFELKASDQNGIIDIDNINVIVLANSSKELDKRKSADTLSTEQFGSTTSTLDTKPPTVVITTPANGARGVPISSKIMVTFSEPMLSSSITTSTFTLKISGSSTYVAGTRSLSSSDGYKNAIFTPSSNLKPSTVYVATLTTGVRDQAGNAMTISKTWWFITASSVASAVDFSDSFDASYSFTQDGQVSPDGKWKMKYLNGGKTTSANGVLTTYPGSASAPTQTLSTLVMSTQKFHNFQLDLDMRTNKQLRTGSPPNSWETAFIFFRYTDETPRSNHHYWFLLKTDGFEFGKKDNAPGDSTLEKQIFLKTGQSPTVKIGSFQHLTVKAVGYHFTIAVDGHTVVDMTDPKVNDPSKMSDGVLGLYEEDSSASFDNIKLTKLS
jgi:Big-like domain-containing protein/3-keto-disaccharide hydrolase/K319-like protein